MPRVVNSGLQPTITEEQRSLFLGNTYIASVSAELGQDATLNIDVNNPDGNGLLLYFYYAEVEHSDDMELTLHTSVSDVTGATDLQEDNNRIGSDVTSNANVREVDSFTSNSTHFSQVYLGSGTEQIFDGYRVLVEAGEDVLLEVDSTTGGNQAGIRMCWAEVNPTR